MLLGAVKFVIGGIGALLTLSLFAAGTPSTFSIYNLLLITVLVGGGIAYVFLQVRDYKPNRRLREDNADLRKDNDDLLRRLDITQRENETLKRSRDFESAMAVTIKEIAEARGEATAEHAAILTAIRELAAAIAGSQKEAST